MTLDSKAATLPARSFMLASCIALTSPPAMNARPLPGRTTQRTAGSFSIPSIASVSVASSSTVARFAARAAAAERWQDVGVRTNAEVPGPVLRRKFRPSPDAMKPLRQSLDSGRLSIRGVDRTLRVAWSLADLAGRDSPNLEDVSTALGFREGDVR